MNSLKPPTAGRFLCALAAVLLAAGCAESSRQEASGKSNVRGINALVDAPELQFQIEERFIENANYKETAGFSEWDDLDYTFNFDYFAPGAEDTERIASQYIDVVADTDYTIALIGSFDNPSIMTWEDEERDWTGDETVFEVDFVHLSPQFGQVDVYYAAEGTAPVLGNEVGTLAYGERLPFIELPEADYEMILTAPDDPSTVLFHSNALLRPTGERITIALFDPDPSITSVVAPVIIFRLGAAQQLRDINTPAEIRIFHGEFGTGNVDAYFANNFTAPVFSNIGFGDLTTYANITNTITPLDITATGDPGNVLIEQDVQLIVNSRRTLTLYGQSPDYLLRELRDDARPLASFPVVRITHISSNIEALDIYEFEAGTVLDETVIPQFGGFVRGLSTEFFGTEPGMREIVVTLNGESTPIAAPLALDLAAGDIVDVAIVDTVDPATVELRIISSNL